MATDTTGGVSVEVESPWGLGDDRENSPEFQQNLTQAKAELAEQNKLQEDDGPPPELAPILEKYQNDPIRLAQAYRGLQQQISRAQQGKAPVPSVDPQQGNGQALPQQPNQAAPVPEEQPQAVGDQVSPERLMEITDSLYEAAGGEAQFQSIRAWARNNLPAQRLEAYDKVLQSGDAENARIHFQAMQYEFQRAKGFEGRLIGGRQPARASNVRAFTSEDQMVQAMMDPRYNPQAREYSESYHREVLERAAMMGR